MDKDLLKAAGLSNNEIDVYLVLLKLGAVPVTKIAKEVELYRTNIYDTLKKLEERGLVSSMIEDKVAKYKAADPEQLLEYVKERVELIEQVMPELNRLKGMPKEKTEIQMFKGKAGIKTVIYDLISYGKDFFWMAGAGRLAEIISPEWTIQRIKEWDRKGVKEYVISTEKQIVPLEKYPYTLKKHEYRLLEKTAPFPSGFTIYGNKVAISFWEPPYFVVLIENEKIAKTYKNYFNYIWKQAKKV